MSNIQYFYLKVAVLVGFFVVEFSRMQAAEAHSRETELSSQGCAALVRQGSLELASRKNIRLCSCLEGC